jgi:hypothetical protein
MLVVYSLIVVSELQPPMLVGSDPLIADKSSRSKYCRADSAPMVEGKLPLNEVVDSSKYVSELRPPILVGIVPVIENKVFSRKYWSFDSDSVAGRLPLKCE